MHTCLLTSLALTCVNLTNIAKESTNSYWNPIVCQLLIVSHSEMWNWSFQIASLTIGRWRCETAGATLLLALAITEPPALLCRLTLHERSFLCTYLLNIRIRKGLSRIITNERTFKGLPGPTFFLRVFKGRANPDTTLHTLISLIMPMSQDRATNRLIWKHFSNVLRLPLSKPRTWKLATSSKKIGWGHRA